MEKSKVSIQFLLTFRQFGDVLFFLYARRLRGYTATLIVVISRALRQLSYYLTRSDSAWVGINLTCVISIVMRGQIVSLSVTCKID